MNTISVILGFQISIGLAEIIIFQLGAILLGFCIHFFYVGRKSVTKVEESVPLETIAEADEWRLKYYEEIDMHEKLEDRVKQEIATYQEKEQVLSRDLEISNEQIRILEEHLAQEEQMKQEIALSQEKEQVLSRELESLKDQVRILEELPAKEPEHAGMETAEYISELLNAQVNLQDHSHRINRLLQQIDLLRDAEKRHLDILKANEHLNDEIRELRHSLTEKETEIQQIRQQQLLSKEMKERLEKAYEEFNFLQNKLQKLEANISNPQNRSFDYEELQQSYFKLTKECDEIKLRYLALLEENQRLSRLLADTEEKLRESTFQRQQLSKKVIFLEELTGDLQQVSGFSKKLEVQLRRLGEIETLLSK